MWLHIQVHPIFLVKKITRHVTATWYESKRCITRPTNLDFHQPPWHPCGQFARASIRVGENLDNLAQGLQVEGAKKWVWLRVPKLGFFSQKNLDFDGFWTISRFVAFDWLFYISISAPREGSTVLPRWPCKVISSISFKGDSSLWWDWSEWSFTGALREHKREFIDYRANMMCDMRCDISFIYCHI